MSYKLLERVYESQPPLDLQGVAKRLDSSKIDNLEYIASQIRASNQSEYNHIFAFEISRQKLLSVNSQANEVSDPFPCKISGTFGEIAVSIAPENIADDLRKSSIDRLARKLNNNLQSYCGLIQFLPFQLNNRNVRDILGKKVNVAFVNLPYDQRGLVRRFNQYGRR